MSSDSQQEKRNTTPGWTPHRIARLNASVVLFRATTGTGGEYVATAHSNGAWDLRVAIRGGSSNPIAIVPGAASLENADLWSLCYALTAMQAIVVATGSRLDALVPVENQQ